MTFLPRLGKALNNPPLFRNKAGIGPDTSAPSDADLIITSRNPHSKTPIPRKLSKSGLIGV